MTENAVRFLAKNELGHFSTARFWPGPSLDWRSPHWHLMGFLCYSSLVTTTKFLKVKSSLKSKVPYFKHLTKVPYKVYLTRNQGKMAIFWNQYFY